MTVHRGIDKQSTGDRFIDHPSQWVFCEPALRFRISGKAGVEWTGISAPEGVPAWARNREMLWNMVDRRYEGRAARPGGATFTPELNFEQRKAQVPDFVQREFVGRGMVADIAMHEPDRGGDSEISTRTSATSISAVRAPASFPMFWETPRPGFP
jgi:hypothetical protein